MSEESAQYLTFVVNGVSYTIPTPGSADSRKVFWKSVYQHLGDEKRHSYSALLKSTLRMSSEISANLKVDNQPIDELEMSKAEQYLDKKEKEIALLERASQLRKRFWKYRKPDDAEVWATRWVATPIFYLFPEKDREEWLGDLYEGNLKLLNDNHPRWLVNIINIGTTIRLVSSALQIRVSDLISLAIGRQK